jgi:hypothetical protein
MLHVISFFLIHVLASICGILIAAKIDREWEKFRNNRRRY